MLIHIPDNLKEKVKFVFGDIKIKNGITLTENERKEFNEFQKYVRY